MKRIIIHGKSASSEFDIDSFQLMYDPGHSCLGTITLQQGDSYAILRGQFAGPGGALTNDPEEVYATQLIHGDITNLHGIGLWSLSIPSSASAMGRKGGSVKSTQKTASSRENGKKGGRPKKEITAILP